MALPKGNRLRQKQRQYDHQRGMCCWCLKPMELKRLTPKEWAKRATFPLMATWEHVIPLALGGNDALINRVLAHRRCNNERGARIGTPHFRSYTLTSQV